MPIAASQSLSSSLFLKPRPLFFHFHSQNLTHPSLRIHTSKHLPLKIHNSSNSHPHAHSHHALQFLKPYLLSQHKPILCGWLCSAVSVYSLSNLLSRFSAVTSADNAVNSVALAALVIARLIASYVQHALLWEAALNAVYEIRRHVFDRVLHRQLAHFESNDGVSAGDIAYRITAEASDLGVTLYTLLNVGTVLFTIIVHLFFHFPSVCL
jgi:putative ABC transport system ATP-binding protein